MLILMGVFVMLSLATAALSLTITRSKLTRGLRVWYSGKLFSELLGCPYCVAHWFAGLLSILVPVSFVSDPILSWFIQTFALVGLATLFTGWMQVNSIWAEDEIAYFKEKLHDSKEQGRKGTG